MNTNKTTDRRITRTRRLLAEALIKLVNNKRYDDITIREITDKADIGYATFFRHYESKDALMLTVFTRMITKLEAMQESHQSDSFEQEGYHFFQHVADHAPLYHSMLDSLMFTRKLRERMVVIVLAHLDNHADELAQSSIPKEIAGQHMVSSILGLVDWWLAHNQPYTVEEMARFYAQLVIQGTWNVLLET